MRRITAAILCLILQGCLAGPLSVDFERRQYNDALQNTAQTQLLLNIIRVQNNEPPLFLDVSEIDAAMSFAGSIGGSVIGLGIGKKNGATFRMGSLTYGTLSPTLSYGETPTIRYIPLQGQALVQQLLTPITVDLVADLFDADVPLPTILDFTADRLTPDLDDYDVAINLIGQLDSYDVLTFAAVSAQPPTVSIAKVAPSITISSTPPQEQHDALELFFNLPDLNCDKTRRIVALWYQLLELYQEPSDSVASDWLSKLATWLSRPYCDAGSIRNIIRPISSLVLRTKPRELRSAPLRRAGAEGSESSFPSAPDLRFRSAYGILRSVDKTEYNPGELIDIVEPAMYQVVRDHAWDDGKQFHTYDLRTLCPPGATSDLCYVARYRFRGPNYDWEAALNRVDYLLASQEQLVLSHHPLRCKDLQHVRCPSKADEDDRTKQGTLLTALDPQDDGNPSLDLKPEGKATERLLEESRRYILIEQSNSCPQETFTSVVYRGRCYWIELNDYITRKNLRFLALLVALQAVPAGSTLTPSLSVGGR